MASFGGVETQNQESTVYEAQKTNSGAGGANGTVHGTYDTSTMPNPLGDALYKIADQVIKVQSNKERAKKVMEGKKAIQQGATVQELREEDSLFNKMFLDNSATMEGAISQEVDNLVSSKYLEMSQKIADPTNPNFRTMRPEEFSSLLTDIEGEMLTGDVYRDAAFLKKWQDKSKALVTTQTKAHFDHATDLNVKAHMQAFDIEKATNKQLKNSGTASEEDIEASKKRLIGLQTNMLNMFGEDNFTSTILLDLDKGDTESYDLWKEQNEENKLLLSPGSKRKLEKAKDVYDEAVKTAKEKAAQNKYGSVIARNYAAFTSKVEEGTATEADIYAYIEQEDAERKELGMKPMPQAERKSLFTKYQKVGKDHAQAIVKERLGTDADEIVMGISNGTMTMTDVNDFIAKVQENPMLSKLIPPAQLTELRKKANEAKDEYNTLTGEINSVIAGNGTILSGKDLEAATNMVINSDVLTPEQKAKFLANAPVPSSQKQKAQGIYDNKLNPETGEVSQTALDETMSNYGIYQAGGNDISKIQKRFTNDSDKLMIKTIYQGFDQNPTWTDEQRQVFAAQTMHNYDRLHKQGYNAAESVNTIIGRINGSTNYKAITDAFGLDSDDAVAIQFEGMIKNEIENMIIRNPTMLSGGISHEDIVELAANNIRERSLGTMVTEYPRDAINFANQEQEVLPLLPEEESFTAAISVLKPFGDRLGASFETDREQDVTNRYYATGLPNGNIILYNDEGRTVQYTPSQIANATKQSYQYGRKLHEYKKQQLQASIDAEEQRAQDIRDAEIMREKRIAGDKAKSLYSNRYK